MLIPKRSVVHLGNSKARLHLKEIQAPLGKKLIGKAPREVFPLLMLQEKIRKSLF